MPINMEPIGQRAMAQPTEPPVSEVGQLSNRLARQEQATGQAIGLRRKQRWVFYGVIVVLFLGALFLIVKVYNDNSKLLANIETATVSLQQKDVDLEKIKQEVKARDEQLQTVDASVEQLQADLQQKMNDLQKVVDDNDKLQAEITAMKTKIASADANVANLVLLSAVKVAKTEADKIALADIAPDGQDIDGDGLADDLEAVLGSDANKSDSDGDGYNDKAEMVGGFDPTSSNKLPVDSKTGAKYRDKIIVQDNQVAWYVGANGKKYFLGTLSDKFKAMRFNPYWTRSQ